MKVEHNKKVLRILLRIGSKTLDDILFLKRKKYNGHIGNFKDYTPVILKLERWLKAINYVILNGWNGEEKHD